MFPSILLAADPAAQLESTLVKVLLQFCVMLLAARGMALLFQRFRQPAVVGEIAAGLLLGPSFFGYFFPDAARFVFDPAVKQAFQMISELGLIFLLFMVGLECDFSHLRTQGRASLAISLAGIAVPFSLGLLAALLSHWYFQFDVNRTGYCLFFGVAMSITAIPVLGRIMLELNLIRTRIGAITLTAAALDDAIGWTLLASISAFIRSAFSLSGTAWMILEIALFALAVIGALRPLLKRAIERSMAKAPELSDNLMALILIVLFLCAIATSLIGIFAVFGAFLLGASLSGSLAFKERFLQRTRNLVTTLFLPIFFTYTGLNTRIGSLHSVELMVLGAIVCMLAIAGKYGGCLLAARASGLGWRESHCIGALMNTRGLMELIAINIGRDLGVIPEPIYCILILMALVTTAMTTPVVLRMMVGTELQEHVERSALGMRGS